jgi:Domain of unknown function (DUF6875)
MLVHPRNQNSYLVTVDDLAADGPLPETLSRYAGPLRAIAEWVRQYLTNPHPELGRSGPVCPYVPTALKRGLLYLTVQPGGRDVLDTTEVAQTVLRYRDWFRELEPREEPAAQFKTILILFPDVCAADAPEVIDRTQAALKPAFVEAGLMIGQFHQLPPTDSGLWNPDFRPLRSPVPLLAIRHMVSSDLPFLDKEQQMLEAYRRVFGNNLTRRQSDGLRDAMRRVMAEGSKRA